VRAQGLHADIGSLKRFKIIDIRLAKKFLFRAGPSGREVISFQKVDSLLVLGCSGELKGLCHAGRRGIREKNLN
jgi:hypothetical protein